MKLDENNIGKFNLLSTLFLLFIFSIIILYLSISSEIKHFENLKQQLQSKFIDEKKEHIKSKVIKINQILTTKFENHNFSLKEKKEFALETFRKLNKEDLGEYFFVFDLIKQNNEYAEKVLVHPILPAGTIMDKERTDLYGKKFVGSYIKDILKNGSTFIDYSFIYPNTKEEKFKTSFLLLNKWNWVVGSGFFQNDIREHLNKIETDLRKKIKGELLKEVIISLVFIIFLIYLISLVNNYTSKVINKFKKEIKDEKLKLEESENYLKQYTHAIEENIIVSKTDLDGKIVYVSDGYCELTGFERDELIGKTHLVVKHPDTSDSFYKGMWKTIKAKKTFHAIMKNLSKKKKTLYFAITISPILDKNGEIIEYIAHRFDITKEKELQKRLRAQNKELRKSQKILEEAQSIAHIGNWEFDYSNDTIVFSNEAKRIFGYDEDVTVLEYDELKKLLDKDEMERVQSKIDDAIEKHIDMFFEHKVNKPNGEIAYVEVKGKLIYSDDGEALKSVGTVNDITERRLAEKELKEKDLMLLQQSKMAAMGEMIGNIAHQWRQPLSAITTTATGLKLQKEMDILEEDFFIEGLEGINTSAQYLSSTIDDFRNFFKPNSAKANFMISSVLNKAISFVKTQFKEKDIEIIEDIEDIEIYSLENELLQVLLNILNNARDELIKKDDRKIIWVKTFTRGYNCVISIKDNGNGIPYHIIDRIFEPYYTTKHQSEGTGLGLYMSEEIIVKHLKGTIIARNITFTLDEKNYSGAEFEISIPK